MLPYDCGIEPQGEKGNWDIIVFAELTTMAQMYPYTVKRGKITVPELHRRELEPFEIDFINSAVGRNQWVIEGSMHGLYLRQGDDTITSLRDKVKLQLCCHVPKSMTTFFTLRQEDNKKMPLFSDDPRYKGLSYQQLGRLLSQHTRIQARDAKLAATKKEINAITAGRNVGKSMWSTLYGMKVMNSVKGILNIDTTA